MAQPTDYNAHFKMPVQSPTEAEYMAVLRVCQGMIWPAKILQGFEIEDLRPIKLFENKKGHIKFSQAEKVGSQTKHILCFPENKTGSYINFSSKKRITAYFQGIF